MSNKKQTAVEWLFDRMVGLAEEYEDGIINYTSYINGINHFLDQAKEMHRQEIENGYWDGGQDVPMSAFRCTQYYNETYEQ